MEQNPLKTLQKKPACMLESVPFNFPHTDFNCGTKVQGLPEQNKPWQKNTQRTAHSYSTDI